MIRAHNAVREFVIPLGVAALAVVPALFLRVTGNAFNHQSIARDFLWAQDTITA